MTRLGIGAMMAQAVLIKRFQVSGELFHSDMATEEAGASVAAAREGRAAKFVYLSAVALATIGWLGFLAWIVKLMI